MFVPHTPEGGLARAIQKSEDIFSALHQVARVRVVERGGTRLQDMLGRKNPWKGKSCGRKDCLLCLSKFRKKGETMACDKENICYVICCDRCKEKKVEAKYYGESSRTGFLRGKEHAQGQAKGYEDNPLAKHDAIHHKGVLGEYSMAVLRQHKSALTRQIQEATEIEMSKASIILNSRGEWNSAHIPRVTIQVGDKVQVHEYQGHPGPQGPPGLQGLPNQQQ